VASLTKHSAVAALLQRTCPQGQAQCSQRAPQRLPLRPSTLPPLLACLLAGVSAISHTYNAASARRNPFLCPIVTEEVLTLSSPADRRDLELPE